MKKAIGNIGMILSLIIIIWLVASIIDVDRHNIGFGDGTETYATWNAFNLIEEVYPCN